MDNKDNKNIKSMIIQLCIILFIIGSYFLIDFNALYQSFKGDTKFIAQSSKCDLHKTPCKITIQDGTSFQLSISPKEIPVMKPIEFTVKSNKKDLKKLMLNIYATNMFMGDFNFTLKNLGNGIYEGEGMLPTCSMGGMIWNAEIKIKKLSKDIGARFQFKTDI